MTITNIAWVAAHKGATITANISGVVVDVIEAGNPEDLRGVFLVIENEETGERAKSYAQVPYTEAEEAEQVAAREAEAEAAQAERDAVEEAAQAERDAALAEAEAEAEKRLDDRVDARIRAILDERSVQA